MILKNFIVFEGIDGAGTSTQLKLLSEKDSENIYITAEPTEFETGIFLRKMLKGDFPLDSKTAAFLFAADRNEHLFGKDGIKEQTEKNKIVACDRYIFSSLAYQSVSCGWDLPYKLNEDFPLPEILFFFEIDPEISLQRIQGRGFTEIYEKLDYLKKTEEQYLKVISFFEKKHPEMKIVRVNACDSIEKTAGMIWSYIEKLPIMKA
ncbi:MAG: dTMP kinase [Treponema sp.]|nr:dTMP kinase [Treponema sp.]